MKIKQVFFGSAVKIKDKMESIVEIDRNDVTMNFTQGVLEVVDNRGKWPSTLIFTTNIKYMHPLVEITETKSKKSKNE